MGSRRGSRFCVETRNLFANVLGKFVLIVDCGIFDEQERPSVLDS